MKTFSLGVGEMTQSVQGLRCGVRILEWKIPEAPWLARPAELWAPGPVIDTVTKKEAENN